MTRFLYIYSGGDYPETPEEAKEIMDKWEAWMSDVGDNLVDGGSPLGERHVLGAASASATNGYSIVEADDLAAATAYCDDHPHLEAGGGIEIIEFAQM